VRRSDFLREVGQALARRPWHGASACGHNAAPIPHAWVGGGRRSPQCRQTIPRRRGSQPSPYAMRFSLLRLLGPPYGLPWRRRI
jgi:hypothetical protein